MPCCVMLLLATQYTVRNSNSSISSNPILQLVGQWEPPATTTTKHTAVVAAVGAAGAPTIAGVVSVRSSNYCLQLHFTAMATPTHSSNNSCNLRLRFRFCRLG